MVWFGLVWFGLGMQVFKGEKSSGPTEEDCATRLEHLVFFRISFPRNPFFFLFFSFLKSKTKTLADQDHEIRKRTEKGEKKGKENYIEKKNKKG